MTTDILKALPRNIHITDSAVARSAWVKYREEKGYGGYAPLLTPPAANAKLNKSKADAIIYGLSLAPASLSEYQVCRYRSKVCEANCVAYAGKGELPNVSKARVTRTEFFVHNPDAFITILTDEIKAAKKEFKGKLAVRLNTFSDIPWERVVPWFFDELKDVQFYDYTKWPNRTPPSNYSLTYSASELTSDTKVANLVKSGTNVAVVFSPSRFKDLPTKWNGLKVIDGDKSDARHMDSTGIVVGLRAKGRMRKNPGGMVRTV
jgi:hypothetical protein